MNQSRRDSVVGMGEGGRVGSKATSQTGDQDIEADADVSEGQDLPEAQEREEKSSRRRPGSWAKRCLRGPSRVQLLSGDWEKPTSRFLKY